MSNPKTFTITLSTRCLFTGSVEASSVEEAIETTYHLWRTECPHRFEQADDAELMDVVAEEVRS